MPNHNILRGAIDRARAAGTGPVYALAAGLALALLALASPTSAHAGDVVVDFDDVAPSSYYGNFRSRGFNISPSCHSDIYQYYDAPTQVMGFDISGCPGGAVSNPNYLGAHFPNSGDKVRVYIDLAGQPFTLRGLDFWYGGRMTVRSSSGGSFAYAASDVTATVDLVGQEWSGITWIELETACPGAPCIFVDNLRFSVFAPVPEPDSRVLLGLGLWALAGMRARSILPR